MLHYFIELHPMTNHMDELVEPAEDLRARAITLREMEGLIGGTVICSPVFVHVVGSKCETQNLGPMQSIQAHLF